MNQVKHNRYQYVYFLNFQWLHWVAAPPITIYMSACQHWGSSSEGI